MDKIEAEMNENRELGIDRWEGNPFSNALAREGEEKDAEMEGLKGRIGQLARQEWRGDERRNMR